MVYRRSADTVKDSVFEFMESPLAGCGLGTRKPSTGRLSAFFEM